MIEKLERFEDISSRHNAIFLARTLPPFSRGFDAEDSGETCAIKFYFTVRHKRNYVDSEEMLDLKATR